MTAISASTVAVYYVGFIAGVYYERGRYYMEKYIRVVKAEQSDVWYADRIGEVFRIHDEWPHYFLVVEDERTRPLIIDKDHCEVVEVVTKGAEESLTAPENTDVDFLRRLDQIDSRLDRIESRLNKLDEQVDSNSSDLGMLGEELAETDYKAGQALTSVRLDRRGYGESAHEDIVKALVITRDHIDDLERDIVLLDNRTHSLKPEGDGYGV